MFRVGDIIRETLDEDNNYYLVMARSEINESYGVVWLDNDV